MSKVCDFFKNINLKNIFPFFKKQLKDGIRPMIIILIVGLAVFPLWILLFGQDEEESFLSIPIVFIVFLTYIVPIYQTKYLTKRKALDCYYSLPISRRSFMNVNFIVGFLHIVIPFTIAYFLGVAVRLVFYVDIEYLNYIPLFFALIGAGLLLYAFNYFICTRANSTVDAVIFLVGYSFVFFAVFSVCYSILNAISLDEIEINNSLWFPFRIFIDISAFYRGRFELRFADTTSNFDYFSIITICIQAACFILMNIFIKYDKAERSEQISSSWFGYKVMLPIYFGTISILFSFMYVNETTLLFFLHVILIVCYLIGNIIYYRKALIPKIEYKKLIIMHVALQVFFIILYFSCIK